MKKYGLLLLCILSMGLLAGCAGRNSSKIQDYRVAEVSASEEKSGFALFFQVLSDYTGVKLKTTDSETRRNRIHIVCDDVSAAELGYTVSEWDQNAFVIFYRDTDIYVLSPTAKGIGRAATYFAKNYVAENGAVLLEEGDYYADMGSRVKDQVYIGNTSIDEYTITYSDNSLRGACQELQYYISQTGGGYLPVAKNASGPYILLELDKNLGEPGERTLTIDNGQVILSAYDKETLYDNLYLFLNTYLGWIKTGTDQAHISNTASVIRVPEQVTVMSQAWMEEREAIITLWNVNKTRGFYLNTDTSLFNNVIDYSEDQLYEYVKMLKYCGFTGVQVTEMCTTWAGVGGYEAAHAKIRMLADAAHSLDMKFTLWVWGAEFCDFGWVDPDVVYSYAEQGYAGARENPDALATFVKYYSIYAELADCCDRVIGHYYDPGNLNTAEDIAFFAKILRDKFQSVNPDIDFGISCWVDVYDKNVFISELGTDVTLYESGHHDNEDDYNTFRSQISQLGVRMGTWAWNTCEMEIDQLAQMNFNMDIIRSVYQTARQYDSIAKPSYWSEMDSYHVLNVFSLYCAGQMLIDPDIPSETLYEGITVATVGPEYAEDFAETLSLIQDARSGHSWDTYIWSNESYVLKSDDYPAQSILDRCNIYIPVMQEMIDAELESYTLPLPVSLKELLSKMVSHLKQIRSYAEFRLALDELEKDYAQGTPAEQLADRLYEIAEPIPDYDSIIGAWGQIEARAQFELVTSFCQRTGLEIPRYPQLEEQRKRFIIGQMISYQRKQSSVFVVGYPYYQYGVAFGGEETAHLVEELVQEGLLVKQEDGTVYLSNWEDYTYYFRQ